MARWLWVGQSCSDAIAAVRPGISIAAVKWQRGLIDAMRQGDPARVSVLSQLPEQAWPAGALVASRDDVVDAISVSYLNVPGIRDYLAGRALIRAIRREVAHNKPQAVFSYNVSRRTAMAGLFSAQVLRVPWVAVVADIPEGARDRARHDEWLSMAQGVVFLSWHSFERSPHKMKLHLDGGVYGGLVPFAPRSTLRRILFTGSMSPHNGLDFLFAAFQQLDLPNAELWLCGKGDRRQLESAIAADRRIKYLGVVSEERLATISAEADVFVNPRPPAQFGNQNNFPSKLFQYLPFGKPIVSTWTGGLAPDYRDVLCVSESDSVEAFSAAMARALLMTDEERATLRNRMFRFIAEQRTWKSQARRLVDWSSALVEQTSW